MSRTTWAARAQLLARLRPFTPAPCGAAAAPGAAGGADEVGRAPLEIVPEVCRHLRGFAPAELRVVLAAFARHPPDSPGLRVAPADAATHGDPVAGAAAPALTAGPAEAGAPQLQLADAVVQLLVGGSRLGTTAQLLDAAEAVAAYAPCRFRFGADFWTVFAERVVRLSALARLDAPSLARVLALCAEWEGRCGAGGGQRQGGRSSGGPWGHMLRSVGGRLADPQHMNALPLEEVVAVARHAARLGEPQLRLAASIGHRVGGKEVAALSAEDLVALIGAAGKLGGRLHMMTRALADQLEHQVALLPIGLLVTLASHLGALEMFPQRLTLALEGVFSTRAAELDSSEALRLLRASGRLRWRLPPLLGPLLETLRPPAALDRMRPAELGSVLYELYRLDLWDEALVAALCERLGRQPVALKTSANALLALSYFAAPAPGLCRRLLRDLVRARELPNEAIFQVKTFEMAVRVGHTAVSFEDLGRTASKWLFSMRKAATPPEARSESAFADDVSAVARSISWKHETEIEVGPYLLDFAAVAEGDDDGPRRTWDASKPGRSLARCCVALEADGPAHFYRPHGRPWHWTSTSKLRHRLLTAARIRVAHVPYYDWAQLQGIDEKEEYLSQLLLRTHGKNLPSGSQSQARSAGH